MTSRTWYTIHYDALGALSGDQALHLRTSTVRSLLCADIVGLVLNPIHGRQNVKRRVGCFHLVASIREIPLERSASTAPTGIGNDAVSSETYCSESPNSDCSSFSDWHVLLRTFGDDQPLSESLGSEQRYGLKKFDGLADVMVI